jgi:hypothetical protein
MGRMADARREVYERLAALLRDQLEPGEQLDGMLCASDSRVFTQQMYAIGVTPGRLVLVPVTLRWQPKGEPWSIAADELASVKGASVGEVVGADKITIRTTTGRKLNLIANDALSSIDAEAYADIDPSELPEQPDDDPYDDAPLDPTGVGALTDWLRANAPS